MIPLKSDVLRAGLLSSALGLAACSTLPTGVADSQCRQRFESLDAHIDEAGVRDGGEARIEGFPYLRVNRFLASFRDEVAEGAAFETWVGHLRELDSRARRAELRNLNLPDWQGALVALDRCGEQLIQQELARSEAKQTLRERAQVPDDYSTTARVFGAYALTAPFLKSGINNYQEEVRAQYRQPLADVSRQLWRPAVAETLVGWTAVRDALGLPRLSNEQWQALAQTHAPEWSVETRGAYDRPGVPALRNGRPAFDAAKPVVHFQPSYTRFGPRVLVQLNYIVWFSERPFASEYDPYAGYLDGVIWRVTLDDQGQPMVYDTIHACGCYHYYFPVQALQQRTDAEYWQETALVPQGTIPAGRPVVALQSATHYVERVLPATQTASENRYELRPYSDLLSLETGDGKHRSLFADDGLIEGSERGESQWLWMTGITSPGAMRQWGRHSTAFVGRAHFDEARALERTFVP